MRARPLQRVLQRIEVRFTHERRHQGDQQQHDQPRRIHHEAGRKADDRDQCLHLPEQLPHHAQPLKRLRARTLQAVLHLAVLELFEIERGRMLHEADRGADRELDPQNAIHQRSRARQRIGDHGQRELDDD